MAVFRVIIVDQGLITCGSWIKRSDCFRSILSRVCTVCQQNKSTSYVEMLSLAVVAEMRAKWKMLRCKSLIGRALVVAEMRAKWEL